MSSDQVMLQEQIIREAALKVEQREAARRVLHGYAAKHEWPPEDLEAVIGSLGLDEEGHKRILDVGVMDFAS